MKGSQCFSLATDRRGNFAQAGPAVDTQPRQPPLQSTEGAIDPSVLPLTPFGITA
jgi:hypothetical protein